MSCDRGITFFLDDNKTNDNGDGKEIDKKYDFINKQQLCTLFGTFLCRRCTTTTWN